MHFCINWDLLSPRDMVVSDNLWPKLGKLDKDYESFEDTFMSTLNKYAPLSES